MADGTPGDLTHALAGRSFEVIADEPRKAARVLAAQPGVLSVAQIGNGLRVLVRDGGDAASALAHAMKQAGLQGEVVVSTPNLEDVFVSATRHDQARERAA